MAEGCCTLLGRQSFGGWVGGWVDASDEVKYFFSFFAWIAVSEKGSDCEARGKGVRPSHAGVFRQSPNDTTARTLRSPPPLIHDALKRLHACVTACVSRTSRRPGLYFVACPFPFSPCGPRISGHIFVDSCDPDIIDQPGIEKSKMYDAWRQKLSAYNTAFLHFSGESGKHAPFEGF